MSYIQSSPLIWSTDVRSTRLYGQFLAGPNHRTLVVISNPDIRSARLYGQFLAGPNHRTLVLISNPDIRSARLYGHFSLEKNADLTSGLDCSQSPKFLKLKVHLCVIHKNGLTVSHRQGKYPRSHYSGNRLHTLYGKH